MEGRGRCIGRHEFEVISLKGLHDGSYGCCFGWGGDGVKKYLGVSIMGGRVEAGLSIKET